MLGTISLGVLFLLLLAVLLELFDSLDSLRDPKVGLYSLDDLSSFKTSEGLILLFRLDSFLGGGFVITFSVMSRRDTDVNVSLLSFGFSNNLNISL